MCFNCTIANSFSKRDECHHLDMQFLQILLLEMNSLEIANLIEYLSFYDEINSKKEFIFKFSLNSLRSIEAF